MANPSSPAAGNDPKADWRALVERIKRGESVVGERLYLLGAGPVPVEGASGGAMTLDRSGAVVLVVSLAEASAGAGEQIARQLTAISGLPGSKLREAGLDPAAGGGLAARHAAFFGLDDPVELNSGQRSVVVLATEPPAESSAALAAALGAAVGGIFLATAAGVVPLTTEDEAEIVLEPEAPVEEAPVEEAVEVEAEPEAAPEAEAEATTEEAPEDVAQAPADELEVAVEEAPEAEAEAEGPAEIEVALDTEAPTEGEAPVEEQAEAPTEDVGQAPPTDEDQAPDLVAPYLDDESSTVIAEEADAVSERTGLAAWPAGNWIGLAMVAVGLVLAWAGIQSTREPTPAEPKTNDEIRTVATGVPLDATHPRWIGQQRVVTLSDGTLAFVYSTGESLNVVKDGASSGATWEEPFVVDDVVGAKSLSVDVDSKDRLHVAYSDGASINYVRLKNKPAQWKPSRIIQIDDDTTSLNVDLAWDEQNQTAHIVWVQQSDEGEAPAWAALTNEGGIRLTEEGVLASAAQDVSVLVSIAADGRSSLLITYRRGDQTAGWSSRWSGGRLSDGRWAFTEEEEVPIASFVGAVDIVYDRQRTAHMVLRDDDALNVAYFTKTGEEPWSEGEIVAQGETVDDVDYPTITYNAGEGNLYVFFQTQEYDPAGEINYMVHQLGGTGWQGPYDITNPADAPEGALYPTAPDRVGLQTIVFWTRTGDAHQVDSAPVVGE